MSAAEVLNQPPVTLPVEPGNIPIDLQDRDQFVCWQWEWRDEKWTKPLMRARGSGYAKANDPKSWAPFLTAINAYRRRNLPGVGYVLSAEDPFTFIDLDHCIDANAGELAKWATAIVDRFRAVDAYIERSPSGTGLHILTRATLPDGSRNKKSLPGGAVEIYDRGRYMTLTGALWDTDPPDQIGDGQAALEAVCAELWPPTASRTLTRDELLTKPPIDDDDDGRLAKACQSKSGAEIQRLFYDGDLGPYGGDDSAADLALCNHLAFWFGPDPVRIDRMFRASVLMRDKWDQRHRGDGATYGQITIERALDGRTEFYRPRVDLRPVTPAHSARGSRQAPAARPTIDAGDQDLERVSAIAWRAVTIANKPPRLFRFGGLPVRIDGLEDDHPVTQPLTADLLSYEAARAAEWIKVGKEDTRAAAPPMRVLKDMLAYQPIPLPPLVGIVRTPVFAPDGSLHDRPGYSEASRTYYAPAPGFIVPPVSQQPTSAELRSAVEILLEDVLGDFPFTGQAERANAFAMVIDPYVRGLINGPTPMRMIEAPTPGVGKGLLVSCALIPAVGREVTAMPAANDDDEWRKRITAQLMQSPIAIPIDNITAPLDSGALAAALTAEWWTDRRLGGSEMVRVPVRSLWIATANNPTMSTEIARRTVRIRMDPKVDQPWRRIGPDGEIPWRHEDLKQWIQEHRARLVWAALTIVRHWQAEGQPLGDVRLGSYERWSHVLGGILGAAGVDGFLGNLDVFYEAADLEGAIWRQFVALWAEEHGTAEVGAGDLFGLALKTEGFDLGAGSERSQRTAFGLALNRQRDRVIGDYRIVNTRIVHQAKKWRLLETQSPFQRLYTEPDDDDQPTYQAGDDPWTR